MIYRVVILSAILLIVPAVLFKVPVSALIAELNMTTPQIANTTSTNADIPKCEDVALTDYAGKCLSNSGAILPLCSVMEDLGLKVGCWDDEDRPERTEAEKEAAEDKGIGCQPEDDYCDYDEHYEYTTIDCIDDRGFDEDDYNG